MITLSEKELRQEPGSSKGNQLKWRSGEYWYKADYTGYEGFSEYMCSRVLKYSSLHEDDFVLYDTEQIAYRAQHLNGCRSRNFLPDGWQLFTLERLVRQKAGISVGASIYRLEKLSDRLQFLEFQAVKATGLRDFGLYLSKMITLDTFFLNEDRHTHNIAVLLSPDGCYHYCPFFDQGASLLSDTTLDYPMHGEIFSLMKTAKSKTFCENFDEALETAEKLYGVNMRFSFTYGDILKIMENENVYPEDVKKRVITILTEQKRKYGYLFQ